jgi:hypothetical protein
VAGHRGRLLERSRRLGGTAWLSQLPPPATGALLDWLVHELGQLPVDVRLGTDATGQVIRALEPDVVLLATGPVRPRLDLPGGDLPTLIASIQRHFLTLPDSTIVRSGHGPETTIGVERLTNPFLTAELGVD